jgi:hypothetical protein
LQAARRPITQRRIRYSWVAALLTAALLGLAAPARADTASPPSQPTADHDALAAYYDCVPYMHGNNVAGWLRLVTFDPPTWEHVPTDDPSLRTWADTDDCKR